MSEISVIIPAYNAEKTIQQCLKSIFAQTFKDFEIIIVNDGSTDKTVEVLQQYQGKVKIINQSNAGAAAARNKGVQDCNAPFIIFCDDDITMKPNMLEIMHQTLQDNPNASYAYSAFKFGFKKFSLWPFDAEKLKQMPYIHTTSLIRHEHFPRFDESLKRFQDWDLFLTMSEQGHVGKFIPKTLFKVKAGGTMSTWIPEFVFNMPYAKKLNSVSQYDEAKKIILKKHNI